MEYDQNKVDEMVLALLYLTAFEHSGATRAWKSYDWEVLARLFANGFIADPKTKAKSVALTELGVQRSRELFRQYFATK